MGGAGSTHGGSTSEDPTAQSAVLKVRHARGGFFPSCRNGAVADLATLGNSTKLREGVMKIASYNVENLFERAAAMNLDSWADGRDILNDYAKFNGLLGKPAYSATDKKAMLDVLKKHKMEKSGESEFFLLRENRGKFLKKASGNKPAEIVATGRDSWIGWLELKTKPVKAAAIVNTGRVMKDVDADILAVVEAENRPGLIRFNDIVLPQADATPYTHVMLIDGNDDRGIDVGIMTRDNFPIVAIASHVDDVDNNGKPVFSRDCASYCIQPPGGERLWILVNHLKSKGFGVPAQSSAKRKLQATRLRAIYDALVVTDPLIAVVGDMNDTPDSDPLSPLLGDGSMLKDVSEHANFDDGGRPGTFSNGTASNKIDYILCSPQLFAKVKQGGIFRMGVWGGVNGTLFPHFDTMQKAEDAASDHAAIWGEFDL